MDLYHLHKFLVPPSPQTTKYDNRMLTLVLWDSGRLSSLLPHSKSFQRCPLSLQVGFEPLGLVSKFYKIQLTPCDVSLKNGSLAQKRRLLQTIAGFASHVTMAFGDNLQSRYRKMAIKCRTKRCLPGGNSDLGTDWPRAEWESDPSW